MYVNGKNRPWVWAVATLHVHACPCMHTTLYFMWFFFAQFSHIFLTLVAVRKRETEIDVAKISFFRFFGSQFVEENFEFDLLFLLLLQMSFKIHAQNVTDIHDAYTYI